MEYRDHRANHSAHVVEGHPEFGACVKFQYEGYEISLAMDGSNTHVFRNASDNTPVFETGGTGVESIIKAKECIDSIKDYGGWVDEDTAS